mmetsp:Transcript_905/g.2088  ORF Transcript_905/g.2088 Transcript_905/m.2088 type:complete len:391 (-) Transcript_905:2641-3813(-)
MFTSAWWLTYIHVQSGCTACRSSHIENYSWVASSAASSLVTAAAVSLLEFVVASAERTCCPSLLGDSFIGNGVSVTPCAAEPLLASWAPDDAKFGAVVASADVSAERVGEDCDSSFGLSPSSGTSTPLSASALICNFDSSFISAPPLDAVTRPFSSLGGLACSPGLGTVRALIADRSLLPRPLFTTDTLFAGSSTGLGIPNSVALASTFWGAVDASVDAGCGKDASVGGAVGSSDVSTVPLAADSSAGSLCFSPGSPSPLPSLVFSSLFSSAPSVVSIGAVSCGGAPGTAAAAAAASASSVFFEIILRRFADSCIASLITSSAAVSAALLVRTTEGVASTVAATHRSEPRREIEVPFGPPQNRGSPEKVSAKSKDEICLFFFSLPSDPWD